MIIAFCSLTGTTRLLALILVLGASTAGAAPALNKVPPPLIDPAVTEAGNVLPAYRGKVVYIDFWASWCPPCRRALPALNALHKRYQSMGFKVIAVNVDENAADMASFLQQFPLSYRNIADPSGRLAEQYNVLVMPSGYLLDHTGKLVAVHRGFLQGDKEKLRDVIERLLRHAGTTVEAAEDKIVSSVVAQSQ